MYFLNLGVKGLKIRSHPGYQATCSSIDQKSYPGYIEHTIATWRFQIHLLAQPVYIHIWRHTAGQRLCVSIKVLHQSEAPAIKTTEKHQLQRNSTEEAARTGRATLRIYAILSCDYLDFESVVMKATGWRKVHSSSSRSLYVRLCQETHQYLASIPAGML